MPLGFILKQLVPLPPDSPHVWVLGTNSSGQSRIYVLDPTTLATVRVLAPQSGFVFRAVVPSDNFMFVAYSNGTSTGVTRYRRDGLSPITSLSGGGGGDVDTGIQAGTVTGGHILFFGGPSGGLSAFNTATLTTAAGYTTFRDPSVYDSGTSQTFTSFTTVFSLQSVYTPYPTGSPTAYNPTVPSPPIPGDNLDGQASNSSNPIAVAKPAAVSVNSSIWWVGRGAGFNSSNTPDGTINKVAREDPSTFVTTLLENPVNGNGQPNNTSNSVAGQIMWAGICYNSSRNTIYVSYPAADKVSFANGRVDALDPTTSVATTVLSNLPFDNTTVLASCDSAGNVLWFTDGVGKVCRIDLTVPTITTTVTLLPFGGNVNPLYTNLSGGLWYSG